MTSHSTDTSGSTDVDRTDDSREAGRTRRTLSRLSKYRSSGTLAMVAGGALLARAVRSGRRSRTVVQGLLGTALLAVGLRQRLGKDRESDRAAGPRYTDATSQRASDEPAGETTTTENLVRDPRQDDARGEEGADVPDDAMAAEPSEATGPESEQSLPTQTEDTEPEPSPPEDESHVQADAGATGDESQDEGTAGSDTDDAVESGREESATGSDEEGEEGS